MPHRRTLVLVPALVFTISGRKVSRIAGGRGAYALQQECL
jgi:hypothetical protein